MERVRQHSVVICWPMGAQWVSLWSDSPYSPVHTVVHCSIVTLIYIYLSNDREVRHGCLKAKYGLKSIDCGGIFNVGSTRNTEAEMAGKVARYSNKLETRSMLFGDFLDGQKSGCL